MADALATLASNWEGMQAAPIKPLVMTSSRFPIHLEEYVLHTHDTEPWYMEIQRFVTKGTYPSEATKSDKLVIRRLASKCREVGGVLYRRSASGVLLKCLSEDEARKTMEEIHREICEPHMNVDSMAKKITRQGFWWPTMRDDCYKYTKRCLQCQFHADHVHVPPTELHNLATPWSFAAWGIDMIGEIRPPASNGHRFIVVAIDYFSKWVEAESFTTVTHVPWRDS
ncbi:hypothetical protein M5689_020572 [Euphorbia peplus]|nr:hypothetical protein M5689_020572 [Euphorbia peplus]